MRKPVLADIARKLGKDKKIQDEIAEGRINNLDELGRKLDELREAGLIVQGRPENNVLSDKTFLIRDNTNLVTWADEIYHWPEEERQQYIAEFMKSETIELTVTGAWYKRTTNIDKSIHLEDLWTRSRSGLSDELEAGGATTSGVRWQPSGDP